MTAPTTADSYSSPLLGAALEIAGIELAFGRPTVAAQWLDRAQAVVDERWRSRWSTERAEAAFGCGDERAAWRMHGDLERAAAMTRDPWTSGAVARTRALLADDVAGCRRWAGLATEHFVSAGASTDAGRALVIAAEATDVNDPARRAGLTEAADLFRIGGAVAWEHRARSGLLPVAVLFNDLTAGERRVADAVVDGARNREVAQRLCMSVRTVETHLDRVYRKLGVRSRTELVRLACT